MHLTRLQRWGTTENPRLIPDRIRQRLMAASQIGSDGCWHYRHIGKNGYGYISIGNHRRLAHRVSYELHGGPIPDGLEIDHLCRNRACIRPDHLEAVTRRINSQRGIAPVQLWLRNTSKTHCPHGHAYDETNTYVSKKGWRRCRTCRNQKQREYMARKRS